MCQWDILAPWRHVVHHLRWRTLLPLHQRHQRAAAFWHLELRHSDSVRQGTIRSCRVGNLHQLYHGILLLVASFERWRSGALPYWFRHGSRYYGCYLGCRWVRSVPGRRLLRERFYPVALSARHVLWRHQLLVLPGRVLLHRLQVLPSGLPIWHLQQRRGSLMHQLQCWLPLRCNQHYANARDALPARFVLPCWRNRANTLPSRYVRLFEWCRVRRSLPSLPRWPLLPVRHGCNQLAEPVPARLLLPCWIALRHAMPCGHVHIRLGRHDPSAVRPLP